MNSKPEKGQFLALIPAWIWIFVLVPMFIPILGLGVWEQVETTIWMEIVYHIANGILMLLLMYSYLKEDWFMVTTDFGYYLKHIALTVGLIAGTEWTLLNTFSFFGFNPTIMLEFLPLVEMSVCQTPLLLIDIKPILGAITVSVFAPISVCALFYCLGFSPVCTKKTWPAYLCIAAVTLIPTIIDILWRGQAALFLSGYLVRLPIHLLACWSYQKTDNVWTPLVSLAIVNLLASVLLPIILF